jgi:hypothetical protein
LSFKYHPRLRIAFGEYIEEADTFTRALATRADFAINGIYSHLPRR